MAEWKQLCNQELGENVYLYSYFSVVLKSWISNNLLNFEN